MFIHIGNNVLISDRKCIGIFNTDTLKESEINRWIIEKTGSEDKVVAIDEDNNITGSAVSPFTVIKRISINKDELAWSREND